MKRIVVFFFAGSFYGSVGDYLHKICGITLYAHQTFQQPNGTPLWTLFLFGFAGLGIGFGFRWFKHLFKAFPQIQFRPRTGQHHAFIGGLAFLSLYALSAFIGRWDPPKVDFILGVLTLIFWKVFDGTVGSLLFGILVGVVGMSTEITLVNLDFFAYGDHLTKLIGVATWVPWLYVTAAIATADMSLLLHSPSGTEKRNAKTEARNN